MDPIQIHKYHYQNDLIHPPTTRLVAVVYQVTGVRTIGVGKLINFALSGFLGESECWINGESVSHPPPPEKLGNEGLFAKKTGANLPKGKLLVETNHHVWRVIFVVFGGVQGKATNRKKKRKFDFCPKKRGWTSSFLSVFFCHWKKVWDIEASRRLHYLLLMEEILHHLGCIKPWK